MSFEKRLGKSLEKLATRTFPMQNQAVQEAIKDLVCPCLETKNQNDNFKALVRKETSLLKIEVII